RFAAWLAAGVYALASPGYGYAGSAANTEIFMLLPVVFGVFCLVVAAEKGCGWLWLAAGALAGLAVLTKQVAVFSFIGPYLFAAWRAYRRWGSRKLAGHTLLLTLGALAAALPIIVWLVAAGAWDAFLEAAFLHNLDYVGSPYHLEKWQLVGQVFLERFVPSDIVLWLMMLGGIASLASPRVRSQPGV